jgi:AcrR family transcriptional regulator
MSTDVTRERLLMAAGRVFAEKGFEASTVREICAAADVNVASVNYYFGDKSQLYLETVRRAHQLRAKERPLPIRSSESTVELRLHDFIFTILQRMLGSEHDPWPGRLMLREVLQPTQACREMAEDYFRPHFEYLLGLLGELLPPGVPAYRQRQIGLGVIGQCLHYRVASEVIQMMTPEEELENHYGVDQLAFHITSTVLASLTSRPTWECDEKLTEVLRSARYVQQEDAV